MTHYPADKILPCHKRLTLVTRRSFAIVWAIRGIQVTARAKIRGFSAALQTTWDTWKRHMVQLKNTFVNENDVCQLLCGLTAEWCMISVQLLDWIKHLCWDEWRSNISNSVHFISDYAQCPWGARHLWGDIVVWGSAGVGGKVEGITKCSRWGGWGRGAGGGWERHGEQGVHQAGGDESWKRRKTSVLIVDRSDKANVKCKWHLLQTWWRSEAVSSGSRKLAH